MRDRGSDGGLSDPTLARDEQQSAIGDALQL
jgi:hypothetical protein